MKNTIVLPTCYLPPVHYFSLLLNSDNIFIENHEYFVKQTYRNRCSIYGANGKLDLVIPLQRSHERTSIHEKKICFASNWKTIHWKSLESAYRSSPYFEFFEPEFKSIFFEKTELLVDFNHKLLVFLINALRLKVNLNATLKWEKEYPAHVDFRNSFYPNENRNQFRFKEVEGYHQVFADKFGFIPNLSIIDLLFNTGLNSIEILNSAKIILNQSGQQKS